MNHVVDETTAEGEGFNFNQWLIDNDLLTIKELFIKHGATTTTTLQISSPEMQSLMVDPDFLSQPQMVPKLVMATHHLDVAEKIITVVLSEKEQAVVERIKREFGKADQLEKEVSRLKTDYPKSQIHFENAKKKRIAAVTAQINVTFNALFAALSYRKEHLLQRLKTLENEAQNDDDEKKTDDISLCAENIGHLKSFLKHKEKEYHGLISGEKNNAQRRREILQIGNDVDNTVSAMRTDIEESTENLRKQMRINTGTGFVVDFMKSSETYDRILSDIGKLGDITGKGCIMLDSFKIIKLYRWGNDVTGSAGWKNRASNTTVDFWQQPNKGKVMVVCRENVTNKLRLNHWLPTAKIANALLRSERFVQWSGFDTIIHAEDEDDNNGLCKFNCRCGDGETAQKFYDLLKKSIDNNEKLAS